MFKFLRRKDTEMESYLEDQRFDEEHEVEDDFDGMGSPAEPVVAPEPTVSFNTVKQEDGTETITVFVSGKGQKGANSDHPNYDLIKERAKAGDPSVMDLFDLAQVAGTKFQKLSRRVSAASGRIYFDGNEMDNALTGQIVNFLREGEDFAPLVKFYEKLETNPNPGSVEHLYKFIQVNEDNDTGAFTITDDGNFIAYKGVKKDGNGGFRSGSSGTAMVDGEVVKGYIPNAVGSTVEMKRDDVVFAPDVLCSTGLHVGTFAYAKSYGSGGAMLKVLIDPQDVVSVPNDSAEKMRVCRYEVLEIITAPESALVVNKSGKDEADEDVEYDIRIGDTFADTDKRRQGSTKKVVEIAEDGYNITVESKNAQGETRDVIIAASRLLSRKYKRIRRGRKS